MFVGRKSIWEGMIYRICILFCIGFLASCGTEQQPSSLSFNASKQSLSQQPYKNNSWGSGYWRVADASIEGNYAVVADPEKPERMVQKFTLKEGDCGKTINWDDCQYNSGRYEFVEDIRSYKPRGQAKEMWYRWEVRLDEGTRWGKQQPIGPIILGQFKQNPINCPLIIYKHQSGSNDSDMQVMISADTGKDPPNDCKSVATKTVGSIKDLIGIWVRVEMFIRWSDDSDGYLEVYLDGKRKMKYQGPTCFAPCTNIYRKYGLYFANQRGGTPLSEINAYYRNVGRSLKRENLPN